PPAGDEDGDAPRLDPADAAAAFGATRFAKFDVTVDALERGDEVELVCLFNTDLFDRPTVERMLAQVERVLEQLAAAPGTAVVDLDLMSAVEREMVIERWNHTGADFPDRCLHQLFEAHAAASPAAVAMTFGDEAVTYGELDERANRLANHLAKRG